MSSATESDPVLAEKIWKEQDQISNMLKANVYTLDILKNNNIGYSWVTIYVGRKLGFLNPEEVSRYAVEYLMANPNCIDSNIAVLAYGASENEIEEVLTKVLNNIGLKIEKAGPMWSLEKRKWRYCILKQLEKSVTNLESFFDSFENIYADLGYPEDMGDFLYNVPEDEQERQSQEYYLKITKKEFKAFLEKERLAIKEKNTDWARSTIYYPIGEDEFKRN